MFIAEKRHGGSGLLDDAILTGCEEGSIENPSRAALRVGRTPP
jgi:hypothetical protein